MLYVFLSVVLEVDLKVIFCCSLWVKKNNKKSLNKIFVKKYSFWYKEIGIGRFKVIGERIVVVLNRNIYCCVFL